ncbi:MAG: G1 family glutamic endopeptidase [Acidimicrobiales bacterium]
MPGGGKSASLVMGAASVLAGALGGVLALAPAAGAATGAAGPAAIAGSAPAVAPFLPGPPLPDGATGTQSNNHVTSSNWSGYAVQSTAAFTAVAGSWTQPTVTCGSQTTYAAFWVGIDGYTSRTVEQLGTDDDCHGGRPSYYAWYEMYPAYPVNLATATHPVKPGDKLTARVVRHGTTYRLAIVDHTEGWSFATSITRSGDANSSAEWIAEAPCCTSGGAPLPLSHFGKVAFTAAKAATGGTMAPVSSFTADNGPHAITMTTSSGVVEATPSALNPTGTAFRITQP